jgi:hypothetical protein
MAGVPEDPADPGMSRRKRKDSPAHVRPESSRTPEGDAPLRPSPMRGCFLGPTRLADAIRAFATTDPAESRRYRRRPADRLRRRDEVRRPGFCPRLRDPSRDAPEPASSHHDRCASLSIPGSGTGERARSRRGAKKSLARPSKMAFSSRRIHDVGHGGQFEPAENRAESQKSLENWAPEVLPDGRLPPGCQERRPAISGCACIGVPCRLTSAEL